MTACSHINRIFETLSHFFLNQEEQKFHRLREELRRANTQKRILEEMVHDTYIQGEKAIKTLLVANRSFQEIISLHGREISDYEKRVAELTELAITDELTGLLTRRGMLSRYYGQIDAIDRTWRKDQEGEYPRACALFIDVDKFKAVNDTFGHSSGDEVLRALAEKMRSSFRSEDILCRLGGDEFLVILPHADIEKAVRKTELFRSQLQSDPKMKPNGHVVTVSIGVAELDFQAHKAEIALEKAMQLADQAMYQAKDQGRDTIVVLS